jgi:hypothetical protein
MTPVVVRLARARRRFALAILVRSLLLAALASATILLLGLLLDTIIGLPLGVRRVLPSLAALGGVATLAILGVPRLRDALRATDESIALWFERRLPSLRYTLVTLADPRAGGLPAAVSASVAAAPLETEARRATREAVLRPAFALVLAVAALLLVPDGAVARVATPRAGDSLSRAGADRRAVGDPLATIVVRVTPPAYSGLPLRAEDDPASVAALVGSTVRISGAGDGVRAVIGDSTRPARETREGWEVSLPLPARSAAVRLVSESRARILVIDPITDSVPTARLDQPTRDSVLRVATGAVPLVAELHDDIGLADAAFEFIVSSGAGEMFTFRSGRLAAQRFAPGTRTARLEGRLVLDTLRLGPGDLIHLRAVGRDRNDVSGPGLGASETRTLRIARADEYDSVSVDPMPPTEPEKNALSQRMILLMTQELEARRRRIGQPELARESRRIAQEQTKLRKRVGEVVFMRLGEGDGGEHAHFAGDGHEHGAEGPVNPDQILAAAEAAANAGANLMLEEGHEESPIVAINRPLLEAYNHMWRAGTELETASPRTAIPWMERAIEALQRARAAERIYLRGRPPRVVVDLAKVRGTGRERGAPGARAPRSPVDAERGARLARFDTVLGLVASDPLAAADSVLLLRLTVPADERATIDALDGASAALRRGGDVTADLQRARRALAGEPVARAGLRAWGR